MAIVNYPVEDVAAVWGGISGTLSDQTDLNTALGLKLAKASNLSDLADAATARANLGIGNIDNTSDANKPVSTASQSALNLKTDKLVTLNNQTGTTYTLAASDANLLVTLSNANPIAVTIPTNASIPIATGTQIDLIQIGAGKVTFSGAGVTINSKSGYKSISAQWVAVTLIKTDTDVWLLIGDLIA